MRPSAEADDTPSSLRWVWVFVIATFLASALFDYPIFGPKPLSDLGGIYMWLVMWCPGIVVLALVFLRKWTFPELGLTSWGGIHLAWGLLFPLAMVVPVWAFAMSAGFCRFIPSALNGHTLSILVLLPAALGRALGEEIGWRGFLFPHLRLRYSFAVASLVTGFIWALWHYAVIVQGSYLDAARVPLSAALVLFTVGMIGESFVYCWLRERSGSLWPAVVLHGFGNWFTQRVMGAVAQPTPVTSLVVGEMSIGCAVVGIILAFLFWKGPKHCQGWEGKE